MQLHLGYAVSTLIFLGFFIVTLIAQVGSGHYHPVFYWAVVVATTTVGTRPRRRRKSSSGIASRRANA